MRAYVVLRTKPRTFRMPTRGVEGVETQMVGRDDELAALAVRLGRRDSRERRLRTVAIVGEPGVGKSRLLYEFENWVELLAQKVYYLEARALATRQNVPYGVFRDLIATRFSILDSDPHRWSSTSFVTDSRRISRPTRPISWVIGWDSTCRRATPFVGCTGRADSRRSVRCTSRRSSGRWRTRISCSWCSRICTGPTPTR